MFPSPISNHLIFFFSSFLFVTIKLIYRILSSLFNFQFMVMLQSSYIESFISEFSSK